MADGIPILRGSNDALRVLILQTDNARLQLLPLLSAVTLLLPSSDFPNSSGDPSFLILQPHDGIKFIGLAALFQLHTSRDHITVFATHTGVT